MINSIIPSVLLLLLQNNFGYIAFGNAHLYSVKRCYQELEKGRKFLQQIKHELIVDEYKRQMQYIHRLKQNSIEMFNFATNEINSPICSIINNSVTNDDNDNNNDNSNDGMTVLINWINEMYNYLSNAKDTCEGPEFHNITTITMPQLGSFFSLFVINHGLSLCSICDRMLTKLETILFSTNSMKFTYTEQTLYQFLVIHIPTVKTICSGLIPTCYHYYKTNGI
ncbi:hypothetical protein LOAG_08826 [Loa loa]|uniref:Saposin B-type domain-containing protein n=1 Tax=Loa loa TaxID=7209 RepID=A0A1S0TUG8_LOALO|nr:hypothetical protein LOAG_08826 [Loa loa]EFO19666.1 hypothetical protein LOAG_08826 [Loa loa]